MSFGRSLIALVAWGALAGAGPNPTAAQPDRPADTILISGRVHTMDATHPRAEAIAVRDGRILFVGSTAHVTALKGPDTRVINLQERTVVPGLVDGHLDVARLAAETQGAGGASVPSLKDRIRKALQLALSYGLTGGHDMGANVETIEAYKELIAAGEFPFRITAYPHVINAGDPLDRILTQGRYEDSGMRLQVRGVHVSLDGPLDARRAALSAPYTDEATSAGAVDLTPDELSRIVEKSLKSGFTLAIDATGDRTNTMALDAIEQGLKRVPVKNHRIRIERAQVLSPADVPRFAELGVIASCQWIQATLDMPFAEKRIGATRMMTAYAWRSLLSAGARLVGGSGGGIDTLSPFMGIHAAVTRQDAKGSPRNGWYPAQKLTREEALRSYTVDAAYAAFQEVRTGILAPGKFADLTVLSRDIMTIDPQDILKTEALLTMVNGVVVFERPLTKPSR